MGITHSETDIIEVSGYSLNQFERVFDAAKALIANVRERFPGEELTCEYMNNLDIAVTEIEKAREIQEAMDDLRQTILDGLQKNSEPTDEYKFTVTSEYGATGEGRTLMGLMCIAENKEKALQRFERIFGEYMARCANIEQGFNFNNYIIKNLMSKETQNQMQDDKCNRNWHAELHFNYS